MNAASQRLNKDPSWHCLHWRLLSRVRCLLQAQFDAAMRHKQALEDDAQMTQQKMDSANALLSALAGEETRWTEQSKEFDDTIQRLTGRFRLTCRHGRTVSTLERLRPVLQVHLPTTLCCKQNAGHLERSSWPSRGASRASGSASHQKKTILWPLVRSAS